MAYITKEKQTVKINPTYKSVVLAEITEKRQIIEDDGSLLWSVQGGFYYYDENGVKCLFRRFVKHFTSTQVKQFYGAYKSQLSNSFPELFDELTEKVLLYIIDQDKANNFNLPAKSWEVYTV